MRTGAMRIVAAAIFLLLAAWAVEGQDEQAGAPPKVVNVLDKPSEPAYSATLAFVPGSDVDRFGSISVFDFDSTWYWIAVKGVTPVDFDLKFHARDIMLVGTTDLDLPRQVAELAFDCAATWRTGDMKLQAGVLPGLRSDLGGFDGDLLGVPVSAAIAYAFDPRIAGTVGFTYRQSFDRAIMPRIGVDWLASDAVRVQAGLPRSEVTVTLDPVCTAHLGFAWENTTYDAQHKGNADRGNMTLEDFQLWAGLTYAMSEDVRFVVDVGQVFGRSVKFERSAVDGEADGISIDDNAFFRFGLVGAI